MNNHSNHRREANKVYPGSTACPLCKTCPKCGLIVHDDKPSMHKPTCEEREAREERS